ncbi:hypothetical protein LJC20_06660, partial [Eubacteriales bacterium OttesenSCG-928-M02]|nr:hypothetical protein [Eubacteriales bacterium OttesenSCG-928-M02]
MSFFLFFQSIISALSLFVLFRCFFYRQTKKSLYFFLLSLSVFFYATGYLLEMDASSLEAAYYAQRMQHYGIPFISVHFYLFIRDYGNRPVKNPFVFIALYLLPILVLFFANAYPDITLYYAHLSFSAHPTPHLIVERGILYHLHVLCSSLLILVAAYEILRYYPSRTVEERRQKYLFFTAAILPHALTFVLAMDVLPLPMQLGSAVLVFALLLWGHYI